MKQKLFLKGILLLFALFIGGANMRADVEVKWVKVDPTTLTRISSTPAKATSPKT